MVHKGIQHCAAVLVLGICHCGDPKKEMAKDCRYPAGCDIHLHDGTVSSKYPVY